MKNHEKMILVLSLFICITGFTNYSVNAFQSLSPASSVRSGHDFQLKIRKQRIRQHMVGTSSTSTSNDSLNEQRSNSEKVSYTLSRGDGSTGGGGLPMPRNDDNDNNLVRPKVNNRFFYTEIKCE